MKTDSRSLMLASLRCLPALPVRVRAVYLNGGWSDFSERPADHDMVKKRDGTTVTGIPIYRAQPVERTMKAEKGSPNATLHLIWQMRNAGWSHEDTRTMMLSKHTMAAKGTTWLREHRDPEGEFETCWRKAAATAHEIEKARPKSRNPRPFKCNTADISKVMSLIEMMADAGEPMNQRALRTSGVLDGKNPEGRVIWCLKWLEEHGLVTFEVGPRRAQFYSPVPLIRTVSPLVHNPVGVEALQEEEAEEAEEMDSSIIDISEWIEETEEPVMGAADERWLEGYLQGVADTEALIAATSQRGGTVRPREKAVLP